MPSFDVKYLKQAVADFYEKRGASFSATRHGHWSGFDLAKEVVKPGDYVVDIGAGNGRLADELPEGVSYLGVEPSQSLRDSAHGEIQLIEGSLPSLPVEDEAADVTACFAVIQHVPPEEQDAARDELIRITKSGGYLVVTSWLPTATDTSHIEGRSSLEKWVPWKADGVTSQRYVFCFDLETWKKLWNDPRIEIERIGFTNIDGWTEDEKLARNVAVVARKK